MKKIIISLTSLVMVVALCLSFVGCAVQPDMPQTTSSDKKTSDTVALSTTLSTESEIAVKESTRQEHVNRGMKLMASGETTYNLAYSSQTLIATITPESATNKNVIWSIAWESPEQSNPIENYFGVVPSYEGSNVAEVRCYSEPQFGNSVAIVTATAEGGAVTATCRVIFRGKPSYMGVSCDLPQDDNGNYLIDIEGWQGYEFSILFQNAQGFVHPDYQVTTVEISSLTGSVIAANAVEDSNGDIYVYQNTEKTIRFNTYLDCFDIRIVGGTLVLHYDLSRFSESSEVGSSDETYYTNYFQSLIEGEEYIMTLKLTNNTGLSTTLSLCFAIPIDGIFLDRDVIYF